MGACVSQDKKDVIDFPTKVRVIGITIFNKDGSKICYNKDDINHQNLVNESIVKDVGVVSQQYVSKIRNIQNQPHFESPFLLETEKHHFEYFNDS